MHLEQKIKQKTAVIGIIGLGYVGLPLAVAFSQAGFTVIGFDIKKERVNSIQSKKSYINDVSNQDITFTATTDHSKLKEVTIVCICTPTPVTKQKQPELKYIVSVAKAISRYMKPPLLVILESTTYPGTTKEIVLPILAKHGQRTLGKDFFLAHVPERIDPGNSAWSMQNIPKIIGGVDNKSTQLTKLLYSQICNRLVVVRDADTAEMVKVFENTFRNVNIAFVNEMLMLCHRLKIDIREVIDAANTKPYGYMAFHPGGGVGGHCINTDPYFLAAKAKECDYHSKFIELAADINEQMPYYAAERIAETVNGLKGKNILVLGITYKKDVADTRESPALKLIDILGSKGAVVTFHDPFFPDKSANLQTGLARADCVVIAVDHTAYDWKMIVNKSKVVFDCKGITRALNSPKVVQL